MNKNTRSTIKMSEILAKIVGSRDLTDNVLKNAVAKAHSALVDLDFSDVEFVSRSAAHELLVLKDYFSYKRFGRKNMNFVNASSDVSSMLRTVASNRALPKHALPEFDAEVVDIDALAKTSCVC